MNLTKTFLAMVFGVISCAWLFLLPVAKADDMPTLDAWVGKDPNTVIDGINFFDHVAFYWAEKQGIPADKIKKIATFKLTTARLMMVSCRFFISLIGC